MRGFKKERGEKQALRENQAKIDNGKVGTSGGKKKGTTGGGSGKICQGWGKVGIWVVIGESRKTCRGHGKKLSNPLN